MRRASPPSAKRWNTCDGVAGVPPMAVISFGSTSAVAVLVLPDEHVLRGRRPRVKARPGVAGDAGLEADARRDLDVDAEAADEVLRLDGIEIGEDLVADRVAVHDGDRPVEEAVPAP